VSFIACLEASYTMPAQDSKMPAFEKVLHPRNPSVSTSKLTSA
jgi:2-polyprenyl-6-methoxyphenol hydroxylase-like FAD-dependent oxidoreductase